jgi:hypothetical protein
VLVLPGVWLDRFIAAAVKVRLGVLLRLAAALAGIATRLEMLQLDVDRAVAAGGNMQELSVAVVAVAVVLRMSEQRV